MRSDVAGYFDTSMCLEAALSTVSVARFIVWYDL